MKLKALRRKLPKGKSGLLPRVYEQVINEVGKDVQKKFNINVRRLIIAHEPGLYGKYYTDERAVSVNPTTMRQQRFQSMNTVLNTVAHEFAHAELHGDPVHHGKKFKRSFKKIWSYVKKKYL